MIHLTLFAPFSHQPVSAGVNLSKTGLNFCCYFRRLQSNAHMCYRRNETQFGNLCQGSCKRQAGGLAKALPLLVVEATAQRLTLQVYNVRLPGFLLAKQRFSISSDTVKSRV